MSLIFFILSACKENDKKFNGYVDSDLLYLSADYGGRLMELPVLRGQIVHKEDFLFKLEQTTEQYNVEISQLNRKALLAERAQILVQLHYNEMNYRRVRGMQNLQAASKNDLEAAERDRDISKQQLDNLDAKIQSNQIDTADKKWIVTRKESLAPEFGIIFDTYYTKGEFVQAGSPVLSLVTQDKIKAVFFVPEEKLSLIKINQKVNLATDNNNHFASGHIYYISNIAEYTPPIIYSREERQKLVFRIEAKIDTPDLEKIHLGQPVTLELLQ